MLRSTRARGHDGMRRTGMFNHDPSTYHDARGFARHYERTIRMPKGCGCGPGVGRSSPSFARRRGRYSDGRRRCGSLPSKLRSMPLHRRRGRGGRPRAQPRGGHAPPDSGMDPSHDRESRLDACERYGRRPPLRRVRGPDAERRGRCRGGQSAARIPVARGSRGPGRAGRVMSPRNSLRRHALTSRPAGVSLGPGDPAGLRSDA